MVRKEELCDWFKTLPAHKRMDYMCGLLHMCLPLELRFIGTVLEDLAKKDFHCLRETEIKANQPNDLSSNNANSLIDSNLRAKILHALALMNSTNSSCAEIIFDILKQHFDNLLGLLHDDRIIANQRVIAEELILILTMAVHHPAFKFYQKTRLGDVLKAFEGHYRELFGDDDEPDLLLSKGFTSEAAELSSVGSRQSPSSLPPEKVTVKAIEIVGTRERDEPRNRRGATEYRIHTTWSNDEITEVCLKYKQLQDIHHKILHRFPEERKKHTFVPVFPGQHTHKGESLTDQIASLNTYLSQLVKAPTHILDCEILTEPLKSGTLVQPPKPSHTASSTSSNTPAISNAPPGSSNFYIQASPSREERGQHIFDYPYPSYRMTMCHPSFPGMMPHSQCSPGPSQLSSTTNSPSNSRTSSPALVTSHAGGKSNYALTGSYRGPMGVTAISMPQPGRSPEEIRQLLRLLGLEQYYDNLKEFSVAQMISMSKEDFAKAGLPVDAQVKLKSKLDQLKQSPQDVNGIVEPMSRVSTAEASPAYPCPTFYNYVTGPLGFLSPPVFPHYVYPAQPALLSSPHSHIQTNENSPANSEASSPSHSPLLAPVVGLSTEHSQGQVINQGLSLHGAPLQMMSPPAAVAADSLTVADVKLLKNAKGLQLDSSGSEEDRGAGFSQEHGSAKIKSHGRPQQSQSLPHINPSSVSVSAMDEARITVMPISMSAPHTHPALINAEARADNTPPPPLTLPVVPVAAASPQISTSPAAIVNGYISDPPPLPPQGAATVIPRTMLNSRAFKTAQPTHTGPGLQKVTIPAYDIAHPPQVLGKNGSGSSGPVIPGNPLIHSYVAPPIASTVPSTQVMTMPPVNLQANNTLQLGPQPPPPPSLVSEGMPYFTMPLFHHPPGPRILTSVANSTTIMTTTQSHPTGPPLSHSPSPVATTACADQGSAAPFIPDVVDHNRSEGPSLTPPSHTPPHISAFKSQTNASGPNSGTPSPPLIPAAPKQPGNTEALQGGRGHPPFFYIVPHQNNGFPPQLLFSQIQQPHFPNGIPPEMYLSTQRFPILAHSPVPPHLYGNTVFPPQSLAATTPNTAPTSSGPATSSNQSHPSAVLSGKSACYNCGQGGHKASECKENTMENMSNTFRLNFNKPKSDSE